VSLKNTPASEHNSGFLRAPDSDYEPISAVYSASCCTAGCASCPRPRGTQERCEGSRQSPNYIYIKRLSVCNRSGSEIFVLTLSREAAMGGGCSRDYEPPPRGGLRHPPHAHTHRHPPTHPLKCGYSNIAICLCTYKVSLDHFFLHQRIFSARTIPSKSRSKIHQIINRRICTR
jgi:hypothetical protein